MNKLIVFVFLCVIVHGKIAAQATLTDAATKNDTLLEVKLINAGTDVNTTDANGLSPLMSASRWGNIASVKLLLLKGATPDKPVSAKGRTPLMVACAYYGGITTCKLLVEKGADVNAVSTDGSTALILAAKFGKANVVDYLLSKRADATKKDATGSTALDYALAADLSIFGTKGIDDCVLDKEATIARLKGATVH